MHSPVAGMGRFRGFHFGTNHAKLDNLQIANSKTRTKRLILDLTAGPVRDDPAGKVQSGPLLKPLPVGRRFRAGSGLDQIPGVYATRTRLI